MSKYRVYELAKEFNTTSKVIIDILARNNIVAKNHMSSLDDAAKAVIDRTFARKTGAPEEPAKPEAAKVAKPAPVQPPRPQQAPYQAAPRRPAQRPQQPSAQWPQQPPAQRPQQPSAQWPQQPSAQRPQQPGAQRPQQPGAQRPQQPSAQRPQQPSAQRPQQRPMAQRPQQPSAQRPQQQSADRRPQQQQFRPSQPSSQQKFSGGPSPGQQSRQNIVRRDGSAGRSSFTNKLNQSEQQGRGGHQGRQYSSSPVKSQSVRTEPVRPKTIKLGEIITVKDVAQKMSREVSEVIKKLMALGIMATINQEIDIETATILASEFGVTVEELPPEVDPTLISELEDEESTLLPRPPVVTIMGHVDHGKTSLLDVIRQTNVTASEAGGITQHIGAYQVNYQSKKVVFLDTPGHEAFTAMRARGAQVTDIAILVVAADDGVMPQTIEALNHAKSANVPIIVAINKMDRPDANPERVKQQLAEHGVIPEDWGGDTIMVPVSARAKTGLSDLLEMILLVAEMRELKANPNRRAQGTIVEAELDKGRGPVATVLVQKGTLHVGDTIIAGTAYGKVRAMINDRGDKVKKAPPSTPVEVLGLSDVPAAGDILHVVDERTARAIAEKRQAKKRTEELGQSQKVSLEDLFKHIQEGTIKDLNIVVKADVQGSIEALRQSLENLKNKEVRVNIVHSGVGAINESDVMLASASNALIIGFNVRPDTNARKAAENEKVDIRTYRVIYDAINDVEAAMTGMLAPEYKEVLLGRAEVRQIINIPKTVVAGSYVLEGKITNASQVRIIRNGIVVHEGKLESLRRFKDDVKEVATGFECGITVEKFRDLKEGDIIEAFTMELVKPGS